MPEYKLKRFQSVSAPADVALCLRWLVEIISRSLPGVRGVRFELELELELPNNGGRQLKSAERERSILVVSHDIAALSNARREGGLGKPTGALGGGL